MRGRGEGWGGRDVTYVGLVHRIRNNDGIIARGYEVRLLLSDGVGAIGVLHGGDDCHIAGEDGRIAIGKTARFTRAKIVNLLHSEMLVKRERERTYRT